MSEGSFYRKDWMTDDQWECAYFFASVVGGFHHVGGEFKQCGSGVKINSYSGLWATWDYNLLTRLVVRGHDEMVRVELRPSGPRMIGFGLWKRHTREGAMHKRHPTIEEAIQYIRGQS